MFRSCEGDIMISSRYASDNFKYSTIFQSHYEFIAKISRQDWSHCIVFCIIDNGDLLPVRQCSLTVLHQYFVIIDRMLYEYIRKRTYFGTKIHTKMITSTHVIHVIAIVWDSIYSSLVQRKWIYEPYPRR